MKKYFLYAIIFLSINHNTWTNKKKEESGVVAPHNNRLSIQSLRAYICTFPAHLQEKIRVKVNQISSNKFMGKILSKLRFFYPVYKYFRAEIYPHTTILTTIEGKKR